MTNEPTPSLAQDEAKLTEYANQLADQVERVAYDWLAGLVTLRAPDLDHSDEIAAALQAAAEVTVRDLRVVLAQDIADQATGPLEVLRRAIHVPTAILADAQVGAARRDDFARSNFPDDVYDLTPASFASVDPTLHEPGILWGAAKAHVHLRRRRESAAE